MACLWSMSVINRLASNLHKCIKALFFLNHRRRALPRCGVTPMCSPGCVAPSLVSGNGGPFSPCPAGDISAEDKEGSALRCERCAEKIPKINIFGVFVCWVLLKCAIRNTVMNLCYRRTSGSEPHVFLYAEAHSLDTWKLRFHALNKWFNIKEYSCLKL